MIDIIQTGMLCRVAQSTWMWKPFRGGTIDDFEAPRSVDTHEILVILDPDASNGFISCLAQDGSLGEVSLWSIIEIK